MKLISTLKKFYKENRRDLPWRNLPADRRGHRDLYKILVSEIMLQQTQVERVIPKYTAFIKEFPTAKKLAAAPLSKVLLLWSGLGYNRRGKFLHEAARVMVEAERSKTPLHRSRAPVHLSEAKEFYGVEFLESLPGIGPYTARAVSVFAYNKPEVFIETNIRTVFTHFYHRQGRDPAGGGGFSRLIDDKELLPLIERALKKSKMEPRDFYAALMDYGSYLKRQGIRINKQSKHYAKQTKFEGSERQLRGAILRILLKNPQTPAQLVKKTSRTKKEVSQLLARLVSEGLAQKERSRYRVAD